MVIPGTLSRAREVKLGSAEALNTLINISSGLCDNRKKDIFVDNLKHFLAMLRLCKACYVWSFSGEM